MFPFRELIRQQRLHCQGRWVIARCSLCSFKSTFHNASNRLSFFLVKRCFRSHRSSPNVTLMFLSLHQPVGPFHEDKLNGRRWSIDSRSPLHDTVADFYVFVVLSSTNPKTRTAYIRSNLRCTIAMLEFARSFILTVYSHISARCRHCQLTVIIITEMVIFQKSTQLIITSLIPFSDPTPNIIIKKNHLDIRDVWSPLI